MSALGGGQLSVRAIRPVCFGEECQVHIRMVRVPAGNRAPSSVLMNRMVHFHSSQRHKRPYTLLIAATCNICLAVNVCEERAECVYT